MQQEATSTDKNNIKKVFESAFSFLIDTLNAEGIKPGEPRLEEIGKIDNGKKWIVRISFLNVDKMNSNPLAQFYGGARESREMEVDANTYEALSAKSV